MSKILFILLIILSHFAISQDTLINSESRENDLRVGFTTNAALIHHRSLSFPQKTINTPFYKEHFNLAPLPRDINREVASIQIGGNLAWIIYSSSKKAVFEFGVDMGYQYSGTISDRIYKRHTTRDTNYMIAEINVDYKLHEIFSDGYILVKSNTNFIDGFIGIGIGHYFSVGSVQVRNSLYETEVEQYKTPIKSYSFFNPYVPFGFEFPLRNKLEDFYLRFIFSIRSETNPVNLNPYRLFVTGGVQFQYQF